MTESLTEFESSHARLLRRCLIVLLAVGIGWRVLRFCLGMPVWGDEAFVGLNLMDRGFGELFLPLEYGQVAPALFIVGEWLMQQWMGASEYTLRILPTLAGIAALLVFAGWARRMVSPLAALFATGILAVSFYPVRHAVEVKPYAFDLLASCVMLWLATAWLERPERGRQLWVLGLVIPVALFASYPAVFVASAIVVAVLPTLVRRGGASAWGGWVLMVVTLAGAAWVTYVFFVVPQRAATQTMMNAYWQKAFLPLSFFPALKFLVMEHVGNLMAYPVGGKNGASSLTFLLFLAGVWTMWRQEACGTQGKRRMLGVMLLPFVLTLAASALQKYPYGDSARVTQHLAPVICLMAGLGIAGLVGMLSPGHRRAATVGIVGCYLVIGFGGAAENVIRPYKRLADWQTREVVEHVLGNGDQVAVAQALRKVPVNFQWYLRKEDPGLTSGSDAVELDGGRELVVLNFDRMENVAESLGRGRRLLARKAYELQTGPEQEPPAFCEVTRWSVREAGVEGGDGGSGNLSQVKVR